MPTPTMPPNDEKCFTILLPYRYFAMKYAPRGSLRNYCISATLSYDRCFLQIIRWSFHVMPLMAPHSLLFCLFLPAAAVVARSKLYVFDADDAAFSSWASRRRARDFFALAARHRALFLLMLTPGAIRRRSSISILDEKRARHAAAPVERRSWPLTPADIAVLRYILADASFARAADAHMRRPGCRYRLMLMPLLGKIRLACYMAFWGCAIMLLFHYNCTSGDVAAVYTARRHQQPSPICADDVAGHGLLFFIYGCFFSEMPAAYVLLCAPRRRAAFVVRMLAAFSINALLPRRSPAQNAYTRYAGCRQHYLYKKMLTLMMLDDDFARHAFSPISCPQPSLNVFLRRLMPSAAAGFCFERRFRAYYDGGMILHVFNVEPAGCQLALPGDRCTLV